MSASSTAQCSLCLHVYDPAVGDPEHGVPAGTTFADLPEGWICPNCGMDKSFYELLPDAPAAPT